MKQYDALDASLRDLLDVGEGLVQEALHRGMQVAECVVRIGAELENTVRLGKPELVRQAEARSLGLRVIQKGRVASTYTSDLTEAGLLRCVEDATELVTLAEKDLCAGPADPSTLCDLSALPTLDLYDPALRGVTPMQGLALAGTAEEAALTLDPRITVSEGGSFACTTGGIGMVLSGGFRASFLNSSCSISATVGAADTGGKKCLGSEWQAKRFLADLGDPRPLGEAAARKALARLGATSLSTRQVPVVFGPEAARVLLIALASCVNGHAIWKKASYLVGREGTRVASECVTVVDNPLLPRGLGSRPFDGEGLPSRLNVVVEKGMLCTYLCDSYAARKLGRSSTGSAVRGGAAGVSVGTTNFLLSPGQDSPEAILAATPQGLYVTHLMGFGFNAVTGDFSKGATGFWIERGELTTPIHEVTLSLNLDTLWQSIDAVGNDLDTRSSVLAPTVRVAHMTVAGELPT